MVSTYTPPEGKVDPNQDMKTPVREQVNAMDAPAYFKLLAELMKTNPPAAEDAHMVARLAKIGIVPGQDFDVSKLDPAVAKALQTVPKTAQEKIMAEFKNIGAPVNGWTYSTKLGVYGKLLVRTKLAISLTPMPECLPFLPDTIAWLRAQGVETITMSPNLYNRGGSLKGHELGTEKLRQIIKQYRLRSQEFDFIPGIRDVYQQWRCNRFKCVRRVM